MLLFGRTRAAGVLFDVLNFSVSAVHLFSLQKANEYLMLKKGAGKRDRTPM